MFLQALHQSSIHKAIEDVGSDKIGTSIMKKKADIFAFRVTQIPFSAAMILKQEALSLGAEFATPKECILGQKKEYDGILFGSLSQLSLLARKCSIQPFGLKDLAKLLQRHLNVESSTKRQIMAIVNVTPDSFFEDSRQTQDDAIRRIDSLMQSEVGIIDIGGASSRPNSTLVDFHVEQERLRGVFAYVKENHLGEKKCFSIDTYNPEVAELALQSGFSMINDVSGLADERMFEVAREYHAKVILMHTRGRPDEMVKLTDYQDLFRQIDDFFMQKLEKCSKYEINDVILDIGFGFAKNTEQNFSLVKNLAHFRHFNLPLLVGASRKNSLQRIANCNAKEALSATLAIHLFALQNGANILRVHDEKEHLDLLEVFEFYDEL